MMRIDRIDASRFTRFAKTRIGLAAGISAIRKQSGFRV
ncbi:hypothetical protein LT85_1754 [Collimonas arenae]|uniref:Uncharacterized protein n=1 Tax=Collimonas arenae TaxID=279058 RepID=A0A0A1FDI0_9BURK|nr:hypothetical protein LT85_1754 [Collimonas arenae]